MPQPNLDMTPSQQEVADVVRDRALAYAIGAYAGKFRVSVTLVGRFCYRVNLYACSPYNDELSDSWFLKAHKKRVSDEMRRLKVTVYDAGVAGEEGIRAAIEPPYSFVDLPSAQSSKKPKLRPGPKPHG